VSLSFETFIFYAVAAITGLCAVAVVVTQNIVRSAAWLLFTLGGTSAIFFMLGADFVAATQLIVYVGGTLVLVVFGVMLTAQGPFITMKSSPAEWAIATLVGLLFLGVLIGSILSDKTWKHADEPREANAINNTSTVALGESLLGVSQATPRAELVGVPHERRQMNYLLPFEIVSVHLLVVLIGAAYLARAKRRRGAVT
jgi:NADH:ubiquinone oxidoreductase subunit 6 (subunit J)